MSGAKSILKRMGSLSLLLSMGFAALLYGATPALAQTAPPLGLVQQFGALGNSGVTGATGAGVIVSGDVGSSPTASITNFPPSTVAPPFILHETNDGVVQQAHADAITAYNFLAAQGPGTVLPAQLDGAVLTSGIYSFTGGAADLAALGTLTLNGPGVFVFQVDSALTANVGSNVIGTADPCDVYWRVGTSATLNGVSFLGNVIADASITVGSGSNVTGRVIAGIGPTGAVTMAGSGGNTIGGCSAAVCPPITLLPAPPLPQGTEGVAYNQTITASGGTEPYTFDVTAGALPPGLSFNTGTGAISGTPTTAGIFNFTVTATDANGCTGLQAYTIVINAAVCPPITLLPAPPLPQGTEGVAYNQTITASGGTAPYTFDVTAGSLPPGLSFNTGTGAISGTPTTPGTFTFTVTATDANGCAGLQAYTLTIAGGPPPPPPPEADIPTLSEWGMIALTLILGCTAVLFMRKKRKS